MTKRSDEPLFKQSHSDYLYALATESFFSLLVRP